MDFDPKHPAEFFDALKGPAPPKPASVSGEPMEQDCFGDIFPALDVESIMNEARALQSAAGLRPYRVFSVVYRETPRGEEVISEAEYLPRPIVDFSDLTIEATSAGSIESGVVTIRELSPSYSEDKIRALYPTRLAKGERAYFEIVIDARDSAPRRRRFALSGVPVRDAYGWTAKATIQRMPRNRDSGEPEKAQFYPERMR